MKQVQQGQKGAGGKDMNEKEFAIICDCHDVLLKHYHNTDLPNPYFLHLLTNTNLLIDMYLTNNKNKRSGSKS